MGLLTGKIGLGDWLKIQGVLWNSNRKTKDGKEVDLIQEIAEHCLDLAKADGKIAADTSIEADPTALDWTAIMEWIKTNLPSIIAFITQILVLFK
jgi:hypothetical protein